MHPPSRHCRNSHSASLLCFSAQFSSVPVFCDGNLLTAGLEDWSYNHVSMSYLFLILSSFLLTLNHIVLYWAIGTIDS